MENQLLKGAKDFFDEEAVAQIGQVLNQDKEGGEAGVECNNSRLVFRFKPTFRFRWNFGNT